MELEFYNIINEELAFARAKHPKFCDFFSEGSVWERAFNNSVECARGFNAVKEEEHRISALGILLEKVKEAEEAYLEDEYDHALQELAQCGAVILRMMEFVKNEKELKK